MDFLVNKAEQLAAHLRKAIARGELPSPLPSLREWSARLTVSTSTLQASLAILKREGLLASRPRSGYHLLHKRPRDIAGSRLAVRWIWHDPKHHSVPPSAEIVAHLGQKLAAQDISLSLDRCDAPRIQSIARAESLPNELIVLSSLSSAQQRLFKRHRNALLLGLPHPNAPLPFISSDIFPAIRHAIHRLRRNGCQRIDFLNIIGRRLHEAFGRLETSYHSFLDDDLERIPGCVRWIPSDPQQQVLALRKMIPQLAPLHGMIVNAPLSPAFIMMVFNHYGVRVHEQIQVLPINSLPSQNTVFPPLACYPYPVEKICAAVTRAALHYFQTGKLPLLEQMVPLSLMESDLHFPEPFPEHLR